MKVSEIISAPAIHAQLDTIASDLATLLARDGADAVPIVDEVGHVVGLVGQEELGAQGGATAQEIMSREVVAVTADTDVDIAEHLLSIPRIRLLPVLDQGRLVGAVRRGDVADSAAQEWSCVVCGELMRGDRPADPCPKCGAAHHRFVRQAPSPGV